MYLFLFSPFQIHYILYIGLVTILTYIVFIFAFYILMYVLSPISSCVVSFLSLYSCFILSLSNLLFLFHTKMP